MDGSIPTTPASTHLIQSLGREHGFEPLAVTGVVPDALRGTLYRVGLGLVDSVGVPVTHLFEADGAASAIRIDDGGRRARFAIFDSRQVDSGPVATLTFAECLPVSFHWVFKRDF